MATTPVTDRASALERALRTLWVSVGVDAAIAFGTGLTLMLNGADVMTLAFWGAVGALAVRSLVTSVATYFVRLKIQPKAG